MRGRGLKQFERAVTVEKHVVAPRAGARIETSPQNESRKIFDVAPRAGARIETTYLERQDLLAGVAPRAGARIET